MKRCAWNSVAAQRWRWGVALFEIVDAENVVVCAVRHQREDDYH